MLNMRLSKDAECLLCVLYNEYLIRRKKGIPDNDAVLFGGSDAIQDEYLPQLSVAGVDKAAGELKDFGFLKCSYGDNMVSYCCLLPNAITHIERIFDTKPDQLPQHIETLLTFISG